MTAPDLDRSVEELLARRYAAGRRARGLDREAPFAWDRGVGLDELEELLDAAIYRRERYRLWYGRSAATWPEHARERMGEALSQIEALRLELRHGPLPVEVHGGGVPGGGSGRDRPPRGILARQPGLFVASPGAS